MTLETPKYLGVKALTDFDKVNIVVLLRNNYTCLKESISEPIDVRDSYTLIFTNESQEDQIKIVSLSSEFAIKADSIDKIMKDIDKKIIELDKIKGYYGIFQSTSCKLMYFRLRSSYKLDETIRESYILYRESILKVL